MAATNGDSQSFLTPEQVARTLGVTRSWVYQHQDELPFTRLGSGPKAILRMDRADLRAYLLRDQRDAECDPQVQSL
jgi:excisionase family DNA binding protein